ncbi:MAG: protoporphyrinogen oxidase [Chloroflexota bacterium]
MASKRVVVVGGGIAGLTAVYRLQKLRPDVEITLLEASDRLGGKLLTEHVDGFVVEGAPDSFLSRKPRGIALVEELGLADKIQGRRPENKRTYVQRHGELHDLPEGLTGLIPTNLDALTNSTLLSTAGVARVAEETAVPVRVGSDDETVANFVTRRLGQEAFENLIEPLMGGIYGGRADLLSLQATFPQLRQLEQRHGSLLGGLTARNGAASAAKYPPFVSLQGGMETLVSALQDEIAGQQVCLGAGVRRIVGENGRFQVEHSLDRHDQVMPDEYDALIVATPAHVASKLVRGVEEELSCSLEKIPHSSSVVVSLGFDASNLPNLHGYGYVIPKAEGKEVLACTWSSQKWAERAPDGKMLLRVFIGRFGKDATGYDDEKLLAMAQAELRETLGITAVPTLTRIHRWPQAMPQYTLGHLERVAAIENCVAQYDNLALAGAYFRGVGIPDCIQSGELAAEKIAKSV